MFVEIELITIAEKLALADNRRYCTWSEYMLIFYRYM